MEKISQNERQRLADKIKVQCVMSNFGLPENAHRIGLGNLSVDDARRLIPAIKELWVRLDLWVTTGTHSSGFIKYPEARRKIEYQLNDNPNILFKALEKDTRSRYF
jgi:hypothetical protein